MRDKTGEGRFLSTLFSEERQLAGWILCPEGRRERLRGTGYDCGYELRLFISLYGEDPDYLEGFVEGCLERIREEENEGLAHPHDVTAEQLERSWREPGFTREEKRELVLEPLLAECEVRKDEGDLWRL